MGNMLHVTQCYVAHGDIWNEKMSCNPFLGTVEVEHQSNLEYLWAVYLWKCIVHCSFSL